MKRFAEGGNTAQVMGMIVDRAWLTDKNFAQVQKAYQCAQDLNLKAGERLGSNSPSTKVVLPSTEKNPFGQPWATVGPPSEFETKDDQMGGLPPSLYESMPGMCHVFQPDRN